MKKTITIDELYDYLLKAQEEKIKDMYSFILHPYRVFVKGKWKKKVQIQMRAI